MQGHKFEDNVNKQLEELALRPTEGVWNRVEVTLRKDRRRRRLFFILPLLLAIILGSYWWIQQPGKQIVITADKKEINQPGTFPDNSKESVSKPAIAKKDMNKEAKSQTLDNTQRIVISPGNNVEASPKNDPTGSEIHHHEIGIKSNKKILIVEPLKLVVSSESIRKKIKKEDQFIQSVNPSGNNSTVDSSERETNSKKMVVMSDKQKSNRNQQVEEKEKLTIVVDKKDSLVTVMNQPNTDSMNGIKKSKGIKINSSGKMKWQWGITANAGIARVAQGGLIHAFEKSLVMDAAAYNGSVQTPGSPGNNKPAFINAGLNGGVGFFVQRNLQGRLQISAGLQYNYFSTNHSIGSRIDSTRIINNGTGSALRVEGYYRNGSDANYTSSYQFLELPLTLHVQLTKTKRTPFYWSSGVSIGQLLATNALHYDGNSGFYYKDNTLFRRTQLAFHTGLSVKLFNHYKYPLEMGPLFHYKLSSLMHSNNNDQRHLLSGSLYVRWFLRK